MIINFSDITKKGISYYLTRGVPKQENASMLVAVANQSEGRLVNS